MRWAAVVAMTLTLSACTATSPAEPAATSTTSTTQSSPPERPPSQPTTSPPEPAPEITLTVVGDIMLSRGVAAAHPRPIDALRPMRPFLRRADITVGNLESSLSTRGLPRQDPPGDSFGADPAVLRGLSDVGFDALSLANNHVGDFGERALLDTLHEFDDSTIADFGAGRDLRSAMRPAIVERSGITVGLLGFNAIGETPAAGQDTPGALSVRMPPRTGPLVPGDLQRELGAVRRLGRRVDVVVVLPHWGTQYTHTPEPIQRTVGRRLVDAGADLVVGGHPHWVQEVERYQGAVIAHSLGNFVFDMDFAEETMEGIALTATITGDQVTDVELTPYRLDATFTPRLVRGPAARAILGDMRDDSGR